MDVLENTNYQDGIEGCLFEREMSDIASNAEGSSSDGIFSLLQEGERAVIEDDVAESVEVTGGQPSVSTAEIDNSAP